jgi:molybdate transport system substrate-binding protein
MGCGWMAAIVWLGMVAAGFGQELRVAAAADLTPLMPTLAAAYEKATGVKLVASFGSSASLEQQIENGMPVDVFLSADFLHPEKLAQAGRTVEAEPVEYAQGVLVLWARKDSPAQPLGLGSLTRASVTRVAVANAMHAPYGVAAMQALDALKLMYAVKPKLVVAENIAQTAEFVESGNAQVGLISKTIAGSAHFREVGTLVELPKVYSPIRQCGVVMKGAKGERSGVEFLKWLTSERVQGMLAGMGLDRAQ